MQQLRSRRETSRALDRRLVDIDGEIAKQSRMETVLRVRQTLCPSIFTE